MKCGDETEETTSQATRRDEEGPDETYLSHTPLEHPQGTEDDEYHQLTRLSAWWEPECDPSVRSWPGTSVKEP